MTSKMKRYYFLLEKQTACKNYCIRTQQKLESSIAYSKIMEELDSLTVFFVKTLKI